MAKSNSADDLLSDLVAKHYTSLKYQHPIIIVNGEKDKNTILESIFVEYARVSKRPVHIFNNVMDCCDFVENQLYDDLYAKCVVIVTDQLAYELIPDIVYCEQIKEIIILNNQPPSEQDRESMKEYSKVREWSRFLFHF